MYQISASEDAEESVAATSVLIPSAFGGSSADADADVDSDPASEGPLRTRAAFPALADDRSAANPAEPVEPGTLDTGILVSGIQTAAGRNAGSRVRIELKTPISTASLRAYEDAINAIPAPPDYAEPVLSGGSEPPAGQSKSAFTWWPWWWWKWPPPPQPATTIL